MAELPPGQIKSLFARYDVNRDRKVSPPEMRKMLRDLDVLLEADEFNALFNQFDNDENGSLDLQEFEHFIYVALNCDFESLPSMLFYISDVDHNHTIDKCELQKLMLRLGYEISENEVVELMEQVGTRSKMNYEQFCQFIRMASE